MISLRHTVGRQVRILRVTRGWSQETLAALAGLNRSYIGAIERSEHNLGLDNLERIAGALEVDPAQLMVGSEVSGHV